MKFNRMNVLGSSYVGLFLVTNDKYCVAPLQLTKIAEKEIEKTLDVKVLKTSIYETSLIAVFSKMNNKKIFLPNNVLPREVETIEKDLKVKILNTKKSLGNLVALNDYGAIVSPELDDESIKKIEEEGLTTEKMSVANTPVVGSSILSTNNGFVMNPNASEEEVKKVKDTLNVNGGFSTANVGDSFIRNSAIANKNGLLAGELTTGHELNRIEEALGDEQ